MKKNIKLIIYPLITILVFAISGLFIVGSINFVSDKISDIFTKNEERIEANIVKLNLADYENVANRLNIEAPTEEEPREETDEEDLEETDEVEASTEDDSSDTLQQE